MDNVFTFNELVQDRGKVNIHMDSFEICGRHAIQYSVMDCG